MFNFLKKSKSSPSTIHDLRSTKLKLSGLDCPSCAIDLDLTLEEIDGVISSKTNYAKMEIKIDFDPNITSLKKIRPIIQQSGYLD